MRRRGFTLIEMMIVVSIIAILAVVIIPRFRRLQDKANLTGCVSNLKSLATAIQLYSIDSSGENPPSLSLLVPDFIRRMPLCPAAGQQETYSGGYVFSDVEETFTVSCRGRFHAASGLAEDQPFYSSRSGIGP
jgi:prepilin-type N-terminal cleavage/methylation domain-containing protein